MSYTIRVGGGCHSGTIGQSGTMGHDSLGVERTAVEWSVTHRGGLRWEVEHRQGCGALGSGIPHLWGKK